MILVELGPDELRRLSWKRVIRKQLKNGRVTFKQAHCEAGHPGAV